MSQFDVHRNPDKQMRRAAPFVVNVQSDLLDDLDTRVVVPLILVKQVDKRVSRLNPAFVVETMTVVLSASELAGVSKRSLGARVGTLARHRSEIMDALDLLFTGI